jgi:hypothetical protein
MERVFAQVDIKTVFAPASTFSDFGSVVSIIVRNAFVLAGVISLVLLVLGGFGVIVGAGSGDTKKLEESKKAITGAVMGLLIVVLSYTIVQIIATVTGLSALKKIVGL